MPVEPAIASLHVSAYRIPTDAPESDGTATWEATTLVLVEVEAGGKTGLGYTYAAAATGAFILEVLRDDVLGRDAMDIPAAHAAMLRAVRNNGRAGVAAAAVSAVDCALWDLKARVLGVSLSALLGRSQARVPLYGSGGFTSYDDARLTDQLGGWADEGFGSVKMKVGGWGIEIDEARVGHARAAIGKECALFVDANGAYTPAEALRAADRFAAHDVAWFEEPVSSDDLAGLRHIRRRAPSGMEIAAGEYGYDIWYFRRMLAAQAVDVLQADATRCGGITGFLQAAELARAFHLPISAHTAPSLHLAACCAVGHAAHMEWFHDHVRIEQMLFDGAAVAVQGHAAPAPDRAGAGLTLRRADAARFAVGL